MKEKTIFPREERSDMLFQKILNDSWACEKLQDLSAFLMAICQNTLFDLLRNSFLIPYRFNADGKQNPVVMTDNNGALLPEYKNAIHEKEYKHFYEVYHDLGNQKNIYLAQAYCYSHSYASDEMNIEQEVIEKSTGVLLIRELPDTVKLKETEAEAYSAVWDLMIELEKNLPMAYVFYGQESGKTRCQSRGNYICKKIIILKLWKKIIWKFPGMIMPEKIMIS